MMPILMQKVPLLGDFFFNILPSVPAFVPYNDFIFFLSNCVPFILWHRLRLNIFWLLLVLSFWYSCDNMLGTKGTFINVCCLRFMLILFCLIFEKKSRNADLIVWQNEKTEKSWKNCLTVMMTRFIFCLFILVQLESHPNICPTDITFPVVTQKVIFVVICCRNDFIY